MISTQLYIIIIILRSATRVTELQAHLGNLKKYQRGRKTFAVKQFPLPPSNANERDYANINMVSQEMRLLASQLATLVLAGTSPHVVGVLGLYAPDPLFTTVPTVPHSAHQPHPHHHQKSPSASAVIGTTSTGHHAAFAPPKLSTSSSLPLLQRNSHNNNNSHISKHNNNNSSDGDNVIQMTMPYYDDNLRKLIWAPQPIPMLVALRIMNDVAKGLLHLHCLGIVHGNVQPGM